MLDALERGGPGASVNPDVSPPHDAVLDYLFREALSGELPVYVGAVPLARLRRFRDDFRPERTPDGSRVVQAIVEQWRADTPSMMWVYPQEDMFVVSDDYFTLAAAERGRPDFVPCWILGPVSDAGLQGLRGPVGPRGLRRLLGVQ